MLGRPVRRRDPAGFLPAGILLIAGCGALAPSLHAQAPGEPRPLDVLVVELDRVTDRPCDDPGGWSNLFFEERPSAPGESVAPFAELAGGERIEVYRRVEESGDTLFAVGSSTEVPDQPLELLEIGVGRCATADVPLPRSSGSVRIQVLRADGWIYGRIAEHRTGSLPTAGGAARVELHPLTRGAVAFDRLADLNVFVDRDLDGRIIRSTTLGAGGGIDFSDEAGDAFIVGTERFALDSIASDGRRLFVRRAGDEAAPFRGFRAPGFVGMDLDGRPHDLARHAGRTVLIEFWSTQCPFSEQARPDVQRLAEELEARGGVYLSMVREVESSEVEAHLAEHPRRGPVLLRDDRSWMRWNPQTATPLFYVIGPDGTILLREMGARAVDLAAVAAGIEPVGDASRSVP